MLRFVSALLLGSLAVTAQAPPCRSSARAIFIGQKGAIAPGCEGSKEELRATAAPADSAPAQPPQRHRKGGGQPASKPPRTELAMASQTSEAMSAMMYWIELVRPTGEMQRVTTDRVFHSGERIRLHVQSNVAGRLTIAQLRPDGSAQVLFPDSRVNGGDSLIEARVDTAIPPSGQFRFDDETGTDRLMILLHPAGSEGGGKPMKAGSVLDTDEATVLARNVTTTRGLVLETVEQPGQTAQYAAARGALALEIRLRHQ